MVVRFDAWQGLPSAPIEDAIKNGPGKGYHKKVNGDARE